MLKYTSMSERSKSGSLEHDDFEWKTLQLALRAAEEGLYIWDIKSGKISYTKQCLHMMGVSMEKTAPNIFTQPELTIHEEDLNFFKSELKHYLQRVTDAPMRIEIRLRNQNSRAWRWVRVNGLVQRTKNFKAKRLVGVWVDITRRKMADLHAMEDRDLFRTLINHLPDSIYFKNRESRFMLANEATAKKMNVPTPSDLIGCTDANFFEASMCEIARNEERMIMETGKPITQRIHCEVWKEQARTWSQISKFPWYSAQGEVRGIVGISSDVTDLVEQRIRTQQMARQMEERNVALEKQINLAREIQHALLPKKIETRSFVTPEGVTRSAKFHHIFRSSRGVSGDCFKVFTVKESGVGILICDVMGHDIRAALIASLLQGLMEQVTNLADTPALLLSSLNRQLCRTFSQSNINMFSTACYVYLDLEKSRLTLSGAGHPAPLGMMADGRIILPPIPRSPALGLMERAPFRESELPLEPGMKLMLYSDGLTEASNIQGEEMGAMHLMEQLPAWPHENIEQLLESSMEVMNDFVSPLAPDDDITLLGVEFLQD